MPDLSLWADDDFINHAHAGSFRPLRLSDPMLRGADVFALQTGLHVFYPTIKADGIYGPKTTDWVGKYQARFKLVNDGIAGGATQVDLTGRLAKKQGTTWGLPVGIPYGHVWQESSGIIGRYSPLYLAGDAQGSRDQGCVMMNDRFYPTELAFDAPKAIDTLCREIKTHFDKYRQQGLAEVRAWQLACGSWNAPAWADMLARGQTLPPANLAWINAYIASVTAFAPELN